jgi:hypothetical protein
MLRESMIELMLQHLIEKFMGWLVIMIEMKEARFLKDVML